MSKLCAARSLLFKAWRVLFLGHSYLLIKKFPQAFALFSRSEQLEKVARARMSETPARDAVDDLWVRPGALWRVAWFGWWWLCGVCWVLGWGWG